MILQKVWLPQLQVIALLRGNLIFNLKWSNYKRLSFSKSSRILLYLTLSMWSLLDHSYSWPSASQCPRTQWASLSRLCMIWLRASLSRLTSPDSTAHRGLQHSWCLTSLRGSMSCTLPDRVSLACCQQWIIYCLQCWTVLCSCWILLLSTSVNTVFSLFLSGECTIFASVHELMANLTLPPCTR